MSERKIRESILPEPHRDFSRRKFLSAVGVAMALPALESLMPRKALASTVAGSTRLAATTATGAPLRTAFIYFPNGAIPAAWWPSGGGKDFQLNRTMKPLEGMKNHLQIFGGLDCVSANPGPDGGGEHARANGCFLTGVRIKKTNGADFHAGVSCDQVMGRQIGLLTPFKTLEISCDVVLNTGSCDTDYSCVYQHNLAWSTPTQPQTPEVHPRLLFERLFGAGAPKDRAKNFAIRQQQKRSILDFLNSERASLSRDVSTRDKEKLDQYYTSVRDIEQRIQAAEQAGANRKLPDGDAPEGIPTKFSEYVRLMYDMLFLAFQTDSTRVATFMIAGDGDNRQYPELNIGDGHHALTHHGGRADWIEQVTQIDTFYCQQLAYFLEKMEAAKDIDGKSMLHNSQIVFGSGCSDGNRHSHTNLPIIMAGNGGGTLNPGRYIRHQNQPLTNLFLSMMDRISDNAPEKFGDSTGRLMDI
jgi:hypothetical protein